MKSVKKKKGGGPITRLIPCPFDDLTMLNPNTSSCIPLPGSYGLVRAAMIGQTRVRLLLSG